LALFSVDSSVSNNSKNLHHFQHAESNANNQTLFIPCGLQGSENSSNLFSDRTLYKTTTPAFSFISPYGGMGGYLVYCV